MEQPPINYCFSLKNPWKGKRRPKNRSTAENPNQGRRWYTPAARWQYAPRLSKAQTANKSRPDLRR
jgi:hypothetical protein